MNNLTKKIGILFLVIALFGVSISFATLNQSFGLQGQNVRNISQMGTPLVNGDLVVQIFDAPSAGLMIYEETFSDAVVDGRWNVMVGENIGLPLDYAKTYYIDLTLLGENINFTDGMGIEVDRQFFVSPLGQIQGSALNISDTSLWSRLGTILSPNTTGDTVKVGDGIQAQKSYGWESENTGWFLVSPGLLRFEVNGFVVADYSSTVYKIESPTLRIRSVGGGSTPSLSYDGDENTGLAYIGADSFGLATGGLTRLIINNSQANFTVPLGFINSTERICTSENALCNQTVSSTEWKQFGGELYTLTQPININMNTSSILNASYVSVDAAGDVGMFDQGSSILGFSGDGYTFDPVSGDQVNYFDLLDFNGDAILTVDSLNNITNWNINSFNITQRQAGANAFRVATSTGSELFRIDGSIPLTPNAAINFGTAMSMEGNSIFQVRQIQGREIPGASLLLGTSTAGAGGDARSIVFQTTNEGAPFASNVIRMTIGSSSGTADIDITNANLNLNNNNITNVSTIFFGSSNTISIDESSGDFRVIGGDLIMGNNDISGIDLLSSTRFEASTAGPATPAYAFTSDPDSGMMRSAADKLGWVTGGINRLNLSTVDFNSSVNMFIMGSQVCTPGNGACNGALLPWTNDSTRTFIKSTFPQTVNISTLIAGTPTGNITFDSTGMTLFGDSRVVQTREIPATSVAGGGISPPDEGIVNGVAFVLDFSDIIEEETFFNLLAFNNVDTSEDVNITFLWSAADATAGSVVWCIEFVGVTPETTEGLSDTTTTICTDDAASGVTDRLQETPPIVLSGGTVAAGDLVPTRMFRSPGNATDTYGADAQLSLIKITSVVNTLGAGV